MGRLLFFFPGVVTEEEKRNVIATTFQGKVIANNYPFKFSNLILCKLDDCQTKTLMKEVKVSPLMFFPE